MSHEIETTAWTNQVPWHGLGTKVEQGTGVDEMLKAAKIDWTVSKRPLWFSDPDVDEDSDELPRSMFNRVGGFYGLVRDNDGSTLDVVGPAYEPIQNHEAFEFFREFVEAGGAYMDTAGSLRKGKMVWGLANLKDTLILPGDDQVEHYLLVACPHQQGKAMLAMLTSVRVVCMNTLAMALKGGSERRFRMLHRRKFDAVAREQAKRVLGLAHEQVAELRETYNELVLKKVTEEQTHTFMRDVFEPEMEVMELVKKPTKSVSLAMQALEHAPGAALASSVGTAWGLVNAVTYVFDHSLGRSADRRLSQAWFGKHAVIKRKAFDAALKI